nr:MAG TPA: hypothetical protein [Caudoviricetes sp.]
MEKKIPAYKGFDEKFQCRDFQYEVGKSYTHEGEIEPCKSGFHACEYPLSVFSYYAPADSRFAEVETSGKVVKSEDKIACEKLKIKTEISLNAMITAAVKFTLSRIKKSKTATNTGDKSAATVVGKESIACGLGYKCKAKGAQGCWLVLAERKENGEILNVKAVKVDGKRILPDTFYQLNGGHFEVVND